MVYNYSTPERILMAIITGSSNIATIPGLFLIKRQKRYFIYYLSIFGLINSLLYHICESLDIVIYLPQLKWHELDNIGAICCMNALIISITPFCFDLSVQRKMNYFSLFMALIFQKRGPWDLFNTIAPIIVIGLICIYQIIKYGKPQYYREGLVQGFIIFIPALAMFVKGLDDGNDYLRIYHSLWHVLIGLSTYYLWQIQYKNVYPLKSMVKDILDGSVLE